MAFDLSSYETVDSRLSRFWSDHPDGRVVTDLVHYTETQFIVRCEVYRAVTDDHPASSGYAEETVSARGVNATSALENAETSAIGRALANLNYATKGKRPSREEMAKTDPRNPVFAAVRIERERLGWTADDVAADYAAWSVGNLLADAAADQLESYLRFLKTQTNESPASPTERPTQ